MPLLEYKLNFVFHTFLNVTIKKQKDVILITKSNTTEDQSERYRKDQ